MKKMTVSQIFRLFVFLAVSGMVMTSLQSQVPDDYKKTKEYKLGDNFVNPKMEIHSTNVANYTQEAAQIVMGVKIVNPNSKSANVKDMTYTVKVDGQSLGRGNYAQDFKLPGKGTVALNLPLDVRFADLPKPEVALSLLSKKNVQMEVDTYFIAAVGPIKRRVHVVYNAKDIELKMLPPGTKLPTMGPQGVEGGESIGQAIQNSMSKQPSAPAEEGNPSAPATTPDSTPPSPPVSSTPVRSSGDGRSANIEQFQINSGVRQGLQSGIQLIVRVFTEGMQGQECILAIFFYNADGSKVNSGEAEYATPSGHATFQRRFTPASNTQALESFNSFIPAKVFKGGKGNMYATLQVVTTDNQILDKARQDFTVR